MITSWANRIDNVIFFHPDLGEIARAKLYFDVVGHYSKPDVLSLTVNEHPKKTVTFVSKVEKAEDESNK